MRIWISISYLLITMIFTLRGSLVPAMLHGVTHEWPACMVVLFLSHLFEQLPWCAVFCWNCNLGFQSGGGANGSRIIVMKSASDMCWEMGTSSTAHIFAAMKFHSDFTKIVVLGGEWGCWV
jgi:hypothetical protein